MIKFYYKMPTSQKVLVSVTGTVVITMWSILWTAVLSLGLKICRVLKKDEKCELKGNKRKDKNTKVYQIFRIILVLHISRLGTEQKCTTRRNMLH